MRVDLIMKEQHEKKILIVGAGFAGVSAALVLAKKKIPGLKIVLINPAPHFEYHATLYRVLAGHSPLEVCIPLRDIFSNRQSGLSRFWRPPSTRGPQNDVELVEDEIADIDFSEKIAVGKSDSIYKFDYLVLALGSETAYPDVKGLKKLSFSMKSINDTIRLNRHLHTSFLECTFLKNKTAKMCNTHIVIVGGGATGVEVAGELLSYTKQLAKKHFIEESLITVDLITSPARLVNDLPEKVSTEIEKRLRNLGANLYLNRRVMKEEVEKVYLKDVELKTKTVIWAAGVKGNHYYADWGLPVDEKGKVAVNEYLRPATGPVGALENIFIVGDGAATKYGGVASTAIYDGRFVAEIIDRTVNGKKLLSYAPGPSPAYIPVGPGWALSLRGSWMISGRLGWFFRRLHDFRFFLSVLPFHKALDAFRSDKILWETCPICSKSSKF